VVYLLPSKEGIYIKDGDSKYCVRPPFFSLSHYRNLSKRTVIIGFVGPRGSGKSVGADRLVITDFMLKGKTVWSNMKIEFYLVMNGSLVHMESKPLDRLSLVDLDKVYRDGLIYVDEVNLMMEARRAMSQENVNFSYILQQLRKRRLTIIWSAQSEMHCDDRLRFQTDIFIMCQDVSINHPHCGVGELSSWKAHDFSGMVTGKNPRNSKDAVFYEGVQWNKPWWNTFDTFEIQDKVTINAKEQQKMSLKKEAENYATEMKTYLREEGIKRIQSRKLWQRWGIDSRKMQILIGSLLSSKHNIVKEDDNPQSKWYVVEDDASIKV